MWASQLRQSPPPPQLAKISLFTKCPIVTEMNPENVLCKAYWVPLATHRIKLGLATTFAPCAFSPASFNGLI